jgi:hypothetical protein
MTPPESRFRVALVGEVNSIVAEGMLDSPVEVVTC